MTKQQRAKLASQIRQAHFSLGSNNSEFNSTSRITYAPSSPVLQNPLPTGSRESHLSLGTHKKEFESEARSRYKPFQNFQESKQDSSKGELRKHHFTLGNHKHQYESTNAQAYQPLALREKYSAQKPTKNTNNFVFGVDKPVNSTIAKTTFTSKPIQQNAGLSGFMKDVRSSHFLMGNSKVDYVSTTKEQFGAKTPEKPNSSELGKYSRQHFTLGTDKPQMVSVTKLNYQQKPSTREPINSKEKNDLRTSHFKLGSEKPNYVSTSSEIYRAKEVTSSSQSAQNSVSMRQSHFNLGNQAKQWSTSYQNFIKDTNITTAEKVHGDNSKSHILIGNDSQPKVTLAMESYKKPQTSGNSSFASPDLRKSHLQLGINNTQFKTLASEYGQKGGKASYIDPCLLADHRSSHFKYGSEPPQYQSLNRQDYSGKTVVKQEPVYSSPNNFSLGTNKSAWKTEQKSSFKWIQPVASEV